MIHSARPIVTPVANIVFCCFVFLALKSGDGHVRKQLPLPAVTLGWPSGSIIQDINIRHMEVELWFKECEESAAMVADVNLLFKDSV